MSTPHRSVAESARRVSGGVVLTRQTRFRNCDPEMRCLAGLSCRTAKDVIMLARVVEPTFWNRQNMTAVSLRYQCVAATPGNAHRSSSSGSLAMAFLCLTFVGRAANNSNPAAAWPRTPAHPASTRCPLRWRAVTGGKTGEILLEARSQDTSI